MTELTRPVKRRTRLPFAHYRRRIVVVLEPGDTIAMRMERTRKMYRAPIATIFHQMIEWEVLGERWRKQAERKMRQRKRVRR